MNEEAMLHVIKAVQISQGIAQATSHKGTDIKWDQELAKTYCELCCASCLYCGDGVICDREAELGDEAWKNRK